MKVLRKNDVAQQGLTVVSVELRGFEYCKLGDLSRMFGVSKRKMAEIIDRLALTHEVKVLDLGQRTLLVNVYDFHKALLECVPARNGVSVGV